MQSIDLLPRNAARTSVKRRPQTSLQKKNCAVSGTLLSLRESIFSPQRLFSWIRRSFSASAPGNLLLSPAHKLANLII